jgi:hypothetical protein
MRGWPIPEKRWQRYRRTARHGSACDGAPLRRYCVRTTSRKAGHKRCLVRDALAEQGSSAGF